MGRVQVSLLLTDSNLCFHSHYGGSKRIRRIHRWSLRLIFKQDPCRSSLRRPDMACFASSLVLQGDKPNRASSENDTPLTREPVSPDEFPSTFQTFDSNRPKVSLELIVRPKVFGAQYESLHRVFGDLLRSDLQLARARCKSDLQVNHALQLDTYRLVALSQRPCASTAQSPY